MQRLVPASDKHQSSESDDRAGRACNPKRVGQFYARQGWVFAELRPIAEGNLPTDRALVHVQRGQQAIGGLGEGKSAMKGGVGPSQVARPVCIHLGGTLARMVGIRLLHPRDVRHVRRLNIEQARLRIIGSAAPIRATQHARQHQGSFVRRRGKERANTILLHLLERLCLQLRGEVERVGCGDPLRTDSGRLRRKRLGRRRSLGWNVAGGNRPFLDRPCRLSAYPVEYKDKPFLGLLSHDIDLFAAHF